MKSIALAVDMCLAEYNDTFRPSDTDLEAGYLVSGCACRAVQSQVTRMQAMKRATMLPPRSRDRTHNSRAASQTEQIVDLADRSDLAWKDSGQLRRRQRAPSQVGVNGREV